jgi:hypothetical protein
MMGRQFKGLAALLLTAFFAVAGSFHHHPLPRTDHDHAGFCSAASYASGLESCALCRIAHTSFQPAAGAVAAVATETDPRPILAATRALSSKECSPLPDPRGPPVV